MIPMNDPRLDLFAGRAAQQVDQLCQLWRIPREVGQDIVKLALFDIVIYIGMPISYLGIYIDIDNRR